jgi:hypothetical protein
MSAWDMIERCVVHQPENQEYASLPGYVWQDHNGDHPVERMCDSGTWLHTTQSPNLLVWNGARHALMMELKEDRC